MQTLIEQVRKTPSIRVLDGLEADELIVADGRVEGVRLVPTGMRGNGTYEFVPACAVVLATGGIGALYATTTNPAYSRGEAIAMAARAGAVIGDAEFVQFHPTAIDVGKDPAPLASEALRGEGATLVNADGERFMEKIDPRGELAPRDIVARAVFDEIAAGRGAFLDCRTSIGDAFPETFPTVYALCRAAGIDPAHARIPIATAAHYHMGGIATDEKGRTSAPGLWAVGEVTSTGLHGANRLASNSLLEAIVFGSRIADEIRSLDRNGRRTPTVSLTRVSENDRKTSTGRTAALNKLRATMTRHVGVVRNAAGLADAIKTLGEIEREADGDRVLSNMALAARFVAGTALLREESRGAHYRGDFAEARPSLAARSFLTLTDLNNLDAQRCLLETAHQEEAHL